MIQNNKHLPLGRREAAQPHTAPRLWREDGSGQSAAFI